MTSRLHGRARSDDGAAAAELAIILPILVMLVFGIIEFGLAFNRLQGVHAAAREGARTGAVGGDECATALSSLSGLSIDGVQCTVDASCPGTAAVVRVEATETIEIPFVGDRSVTLTGRGEFRCEV